MKQRSSSRCSPISCTGREYEDEPSSIGLRQAASSHPRAGRQRTVLVLDLDSVGRASRPGCCRPAGVRRHAAIGGRNVYPLVERRPVIVYRCAGPARRRRGRQFDGRAAAARVGTSRRRCGIGRLVQSRRFLARLGATRVLLLDLVVDLCGAPVSAGRRSPRDSGARLGSAL